MKKISIIIPCHNSVKWLNDCFESLKKQTIGIGNLECIFVDDASTDDGATVAMLKDFEKENPDNVMVILLEDNLRQGGARNIAMQYMSGEYLLFLDSDDMLLPYTCERLYEIASENTADMVLFGYETIYGDDTGYDAVSRINQIAGVINTIDFNLYPNTKNDYLIGAKGSFGCWNKLYRTDLVKRSGATYAEHVVYEEPKFVYPQYLFVDNIVETDEKLYVYRKHHGSTMTAEVGKRLLDHPQVQLELYGYLMSLGDIYKKHKEEIDFHFVYSYYLETLYFSAKNPGAVLPLDYYKYMQSVCRKLVPDILSSKYIFNKSDRNVFESIFTDVNSEDELRKICNAI